MIQDLIDACELGAFVPLGSAAAGVSAAAAAKPKPPRRTRSAGSAALASAPKRRCRSRPAASATTPSCSAATASAAAARPAVALQAPPMIAEPAEPAMTSEAYSDDESHIRRHGQCPKRAANEMCKCEVCVAIDACPRCFFRSHANRLRQVASFQGPNNERMTWLVERKPTWAGAWALGCSLCANHARQKPRNGRFQTKQSPHTWARIACRVKVNNLSLKRHADTPEHKKAVELNQLPPAGASLIANQQPHVEDHPSCTEEQPFGTSVPQPQDYLRVWEGIRSATPGRGVNRAGAIEDYISKPADSKVDRDPRSRLTQIAYVMAEVVRQDDRAFLATCSDCSLCMDAGASKNVISFVAAAATAEVVQTRAGLIGIVDDEVLPNAGAASAAPGVSAGAADAVDKVREQKSNRCKEDVMTCLRQFHSARHQANKNAGIFDKRAFDHHRSIVRLCTLDGASDAQLTGRKLAADPRCLPNVRCVARDRAHACRANIKAPLNADPEMVRIRDQLISKKDSLAKLLQYAPRARKVHMTCQQAVLNTDGVQGGGLDAVLKNF